MNNNQKGIIRFCTQSLPKRTHIYLSFFLISISIIRTSRANTFSSQELSVQTADECTWIDDQLQIEESWKLLRNAGHDRPGENITVAQLDTGVVPIPTLLETHMTSGGKSGLWLPNEKTSTHSFNFVQNIVSPIDNDPDSLNFGHGTTTASLLVGWMNHTGVSGFVFRGAAPWIRLIPMKVTDSVVLVGNRPTGGIADARNLAEGIRLATQLRVDIISISLGAVFDDAETIKNAVQSAVDSGIIVIAAGGQGIPFQLAPLPARLPEVVAVSASSRNSQAWNESFFGRHIDWSAPGVDVCMIKAQKAAPQRFRDANTSPQVQIIGRDNQLLTFQDSLVRTSGTSYSTVYTAAAAALWLQFHSPEKLRHLYGQKNISKVFAQVAKQFALDTPADWQRQKFGDGILNIRKLIQAPLPCQLREIRSPENKKLNFDKRQDTTLDTEGC